MDTEHSAITEPVRRFEVFTGAGRRRTWSDEDKARIVAESLTSEESVCAVARRHGLSPQQLFGWRRRLRESQVGFPPCKAEPGAGAIEIEIDGVMIRVGRGADAKTLMTVLRALKAGA